MLTQASAFGAHSGRRYGSFVGKPAATVSSHPVVKITQALAFGAFSGRRYGSFSGKPPADLTGNANEWRKFAMQKGRR